MTEKKATQKYFGIDVLKFLMAICVVALHTKPMDCVNSQIMLRIYNIFVSCAVPSFFIASGFLLAHKSGETSEQYGKIYKQAVHIGKIYVTWSIVYLPLAIYSYAVLYQSGFVKSVLSYIRNFLFVGEHYDSWQLWYLLSTIYTLLFLYLFAKRFGLYKASLFLWIISITLWFIVEVLPQNSSNTILINTHRVIEATIGSNRILQGGICIPLGVFAQYCERQNSLFNKYQLAITIIAVATIEMYVGSNFIISTILSLGLLMSVIKIRNQNELAGKFLRFSSLVIYTTHMYFVFFCDAIFGIEKAHISFLLTIVATIGLSIILWIQRKKVKWIRCLWG